VNLELFRERLDLHELRGLRMAVEKPCRRAEQIQVLVDLLDDSGSPNLDRDLAAVREEGAVDLRDRCRRDRLRIDPENRSGSKSSLITASICANGTGGTSSTSRPSSSM
jgi:hypothetical protein